MYQEIFSATNQYNDVGNYWERGNKNEIDLVAINDIEKNILIGEIKLNKDKISLNKLQNKSKELLKKYKGYSVKYIALGMQDIDNYI